MRFWKSRLCIAVVFSLILCGISGCGLTDTPEDECVVRKKTSDTAQTENVVSGDGLTIAGQVQAEKEYQYHAVKDGLEVSAQAKIKIPKEEGFKTWKATPYYFNQEDIDGWIKVLAQGKNLWVWEDEYVLTYEDVYEWQNTLIQEMEELYANEPTDWNQKNRWIVKSNVLALGIEECEQALTNGWLLEERKKQIIEWKQIEYSYPEKEKAEEQLLYGMVDIVDSFAPWAEQEEKTFVLDIENRRNSTSMSTCFSFARKYRSNYSEISEREIVENTKTEISRKTMRKASDALVEQLGLDEDLVFAKAEAVYNRGPSASPYGDRCLNDQKGWRFAYTRQLEDIKLNYSPSILTEPENMIPVVDSVYYGGDVETQVASDMYVNLISLEEGWRKEIFYITFDDEGLVSVEWENPCVVEKVSNENLFLLPFLEIAQIFEKSISGQPVLEALATAGFEIKADITEIRLGYMRTNVDDSGQAQMIPVWDFIGTLSCQNLEELGLNESSMISEYFAHLLAESLFTINATDGAIINRTQG